MFSILSAGTLTCRKFDTGDFLSRKTNFFKKGRPLRAHAEKGFGNGNSPRVPKTVETF